MRPVTATSAPSRTPLRPGVDLVWEERAGRLFAEFERPAKSMVRRAFRGAFGDDELDDIYSGAWVGTLRALADRHVELDDDEIRSYVLTAVANQAGKELRRRRRKPTAPIELVSGVADHSDTPEERATSAEQSAIARDVLASLPPRRRAVMLLRYGWGLEPSQVCGLIKGLSPRAYRKEITRGVDEVTARMRAVEAGEWCADREPLLKQFVAGLADEDATRQARAHLSHCRSCADFVSRLSGHLHDLGGGAVGATGAIDGIDGHLGIGDRLLELGDRATGALARSGGGEAADVTGPLVGSGGARGAGAAGAGVLAKLAGAGVTSKLALACFGGGAVATACIAAGVTPFGSGGDAERSSARTQAVQREPQRDEGQSVDVEIAPADHQPPVPAPAIQNQTATSEPKPADREREPAPETEEPEVAVTAPPEEQEFGVAAAAVPPPSQSVAPAPAPAPSGGGAELSESAAAQQEFGP